MAAGKDWSPETYARFRGLRLRPALDLLAQVQDLPEGDVIDLGCGNGAVGPALAALFPGRKLIGIDQSPAMLAEAAATGAYRRCLAEDAAVWEPATPPALIFSNAALQWLGNHDTLLPHLAGLVGPGGTLAVQMPRQFNAPSHRFLREFAADMFPDRFDFVDWHPPVRAPMDYHRLLAPLGQLNVWETDYIHRLCPDGTGHPVRRFTEGAAMRPFLDLLTPAETDAFVARYDEALASAYPAEDDGSVLFPFRRVFIVLQMPAHPF
ncbi:methyltransferase domain-containing protein [Frigidibacter sp.]|uniref:methyltransferase domain-containing protein n=1 Tax=Frigidibacter sp. TaxID=2586418 RepID=UPI002734E10E|nr:methyltransferase domain-containing protein [Frigidibacter sp.]MDP3338824.1 methyltransferase domain-containing protein [Frigidibacter sp.]